MRRGEIYTETVAHLAPERFAADVPYQVVIVSLETRMMPKSSIDPSDICTFGS